MEKVLEIYTDGSSLGNPGRGGWGVVITSSDKVIKELGGFETNTTNNRMELMAVIEILKYYKFHKSEFYNVKEIIIHADSSYVLLGITTWIYNWEKNGWRTATKKPVLNIDLWQELISLIRELDETIKISWQKVKGHAGILHNERADLIATSCSSNQKNHAL